MSEETLLIKLNNVRLFEEVSKLKQENLKSIDEKSQAKDLIVQYKDALEKKNNELEIIQKEKAELEEKYNKIPEFVRNFFG